MNINMNSPYTEGSLILKQAKVLDVEHQIDELVYKLYGLTNEEIKIVENNGK